MPHRTTLRQLRGRYSRQTPLMVYTLRQHIAHGTIRTGICFPVESRKLFDLRFFKTESFRTTDNGVSQMEMEAPDFSSYTQIS